jgi:hypothetical protein
VDNVDDLYADIAETLEAVETVAGPGTLVSHGSKGGSMGGKEGGPGRSGGGGKGDDESKDRDRERERAAAVKAQLIAQGAIRRGGRGRGALRGRALWGLGAVALGWAAAPGRAGARLGGPASSARDQRAGSRGPAEAPQLAACSTPHARPALAPL